MSEPIFAATAPVHTHLPVFACQKIVELFACDWLLGRRKPDVVASARFARDIDTALCPAPTDAASRLAWFVKQTMLLTLRHVECMTNRG